MTRRDGERRFDRYGEFRLMARAEGYVMARRVGLSPFVCTEREWNAMARGPDLVKPDGPKLIISNENPARREPA